MPSILRWITSLFAGLFGLAAVMTSLWMFAAQGFTLFSGTGLLFLLVLQIGILCFWAAGSLIAQALRES